MTLIVCLVFSVSVQCLFCVGWFDLFCFLSAHCYRVVRVWCFVEFVTVYAGWKSPKDSLISPCENIQSWNRKNQLCKLNNKSRPERRNLEKWASLLNSLSLHWGLSSRTCSRGWEDRAGRESLANTVRVENWITKSCRESWIVGDGIGDWANRANS